MGRPCSVCSSPQKTEINKTLVAKTESFRVTAQRFNVSEPAIQRHAQSHIPRQLAQRAAQTEALQERNLLDRIENDIDYMVRVREKAERKGDLKTVTSAQRELTRLSAILLPRTPLVNLVQVNAPAGAPVDLDEARRYVRLFQETEADEARDLANAPGTVQVLQPAKVGGQP